MDGATDLDRLLDLARDASEDGRALLLRSTASAYAERADFATSLERDLFVQVAVHLLERAQLQVRVAFAEHVADKAWAPRALALHLALDEPPVATPVIKRSPVLDDGALIDILRRGDRPHKVAVAEREGISNVVARATIEVGAEEVLTALAHNLKTAMDEQTLMRAVAASREHPGALAAFVERLDLPLETVKQVYSWAGEELKGRIRSLYDITPAEAAAAAATAAVTAAARAGYAVGAPDISEIKDAVFGVSTPGALLRMLLAGKRSAFDTEIAVALGVSTERLAVAFNRGDVRTIALLGRAFAFDQRSAPMLLTELLPPGRVGWDATAERDVRFVYETLQPEEARAALRAMILKPN